MNHSSLGSKLSIAEEWENFAGLVLPKGLPKSSPQYKDMRNTFYAGFLSSTTIFFNISKTDNEDKAVKILTDLCLEINAFGEDIKSKNLSKN